MALNLNLRIVPKPKTQVHVSRTGQLAPKGRALNPFEQTARCRGRLPAGS